MKATDKADKATNPLKKSLAQKSPSPVTIDRADLVAQLAKNLNITKIEANQVLSTFLDTFTDVFKNSDRLKLVGFGTFEKKVRSARIGRNPQTGDKMTIEPKTIIGFKMGKKLSDSLTEK